MRREDIKKGGTILKMSKKDIAINQSGKAKVQTREEIRANALSYLKSTINKRTLTGMIEMVERNSEARTAGMSVFAIVNHDGIKVMIPAKEMGIELPKSVKDANKDDKARAYSMLINAMIGSEIDYIVKKVDTTGEYATASRERAMKGKAKSFYLDKDKKTGLSKAEAALESGARVESRIVSISASTIKVEIMGVETRIHAKEASHRFLNRLTDKFSVGDRVFVVLTDLSIGEPTDGEDGEESEKDASKNSESIRVKASIKAATPNRAVENAKAYSVGSSCMGKVTGITEHGVFLALGDLDTGIDALSSDIKTFEVPAVGDQVLCYIKQVDEEKGRAYVSITRIIRRG